MCAPEMEPHTEEEDDEEEQALVPIEHQQPRAPPPQVMEYAVPVQQPGLGLILEGYKMWHLTQKETTQRGRIGLDNGNGTLLGECRLAECVHLGEKWNDRFYAAPKSGLNLESTFHFHRTQLSRVGHGKVWAYVLEDVVRYERPVPNPMSQHLRADGLLMVSEDTSVMADEEYVRCRPVPRAVPRWRVLREEQFAQQQAQLMLNDGTSDDEYKSRARPTPSIRKAVFSSKSTHGMSTRARTR